MKITLKNVTLKSPFCTDEFDYMRYANYSKSCIYAMTSDFTAVGIPASVSLNVRCDPGTFTHKFLGNIGGNLAHNVKMEAVPFNDTKFKETVSVDIDIDEIFPSYLYEAEIICEDNPDIKFKFEFDPNHKIHANELKYLEWYRIGNTPFSLDNEDILTVSLKNFKEENTPIPPAH